MSIQKFLLNLNLKHRKPKIDKIMKNIKTNVQIKLLEKELQEMREYHSDIWNTYGSELCSGDMERKEKQLEDKIEKLKNDQ